MEIPSGEGVLKFNADCTYETGDTASISYAGTWILSGDSLITYEASDILASRVLLSGTTLVLTIKYNTGLGEYSSLDTMEIFYGLAPGTLVAVDANAVMTLAQVRQPATIFQ